MNKKIIFGLICGLLMIAIVYATVVPVNPAIDETTNADTYDFTATSDNPFHIALPPSDHINLEFDGSKQMDCVWNGIDYDCSLLAVDISAMNGVYAVTMEDNDGIVVAGTLTIDQEVIAGDFGFGASGNNVSYTLNCDCDPSGCAAEEVWYSDDDWASHTVATTNPETIVNGTYKFIGYCEDNAGNNANSTETQFTLPAVPPVLIEVIDLPSTVVCQEPGISCASPISYGPLDGGGSPIDISFKVVFNVPVAITVTLDGGSPVGPSGYFNEHVILLGAVTEASHSLSIQASDGINLATFIMNFDVINTGTGGGITIDIRDSIPVNATNPSIEFLSSYVIKNEVLPGDFALVNYTLFMVKGEYTRFSFTGDADFVAPITIFCEDNFDGLDIINPLDPNVFNIDLLDGMMNETKNAMTCLIKSGDIDSGLIYDIVVKYPISNMATGGAVAGTLNVGLYKNDLYTQCSDGIDNDADTFIDFPDDPECIDLDDNDESA